MSKGFVNTDIVGIEPIELNSVQAYKASAIMLDFTEYSNSIILITSYSKKGFFNSEVIALQPLIDGYYQSPIMLFEGNDTQIQISFDTTYGSHHISIIPVTMYEGFFGAYRLA